MKDSQIIVELSEQGVIRVQIHGDNTLEKQAAHLLLARIQPEMDALDQALKSAGNAHSDARRGVRAERGSSANRIMTAGNSPAGD